jgi:hypothetical protein
VTRNDRIPFLDIVTPHVELEEELCAVFKGALRTAGFLVAPLWMASKPSSPRFARSAIA